MDNNASDYRSEDSKDTACYSESNKTLDMYFLISGNLLRKK